MCWIVNFIRKRWIFFILLLFLIFLFSNFILIFWIHNFHTNIYEQFFTNNNIYEPVNKSNKDQNVISNLPFLVGEFMRINNSVHDEIIGLHARRKELLDANTIIQNKIENLKYILFKEVKHLAKLRVSIFKI